ncbi:MAG: hypothetical protein JXR88_03635 [Clostridia bacterium]|nr:hypothetical protein [Clostridia bacterium]
MLRKTFLLAVALWLMFASVSFADDAIKYKEEQLETDIEIMSARSDYYVLDGELGFLSMPDPFEQISNIIFGIHRFFVRLVCLLIINAFTLNLYTIFSSELVLILKPLKTVVFDSWLYLILGVSLLHILLQAGTGRTTSSAGEFVKLVLVLMFALAFLAFPADFITGGKEVSSFVANELITEAFIQDRSLSVDDGVAVLSNEIWKAQVDKPWRVLNFRDQSDTYYDQFLSLEPESDARERATKSLRNEVPIASYSWVFTTFLLGLFAIPELLIYGILAAIAVASEPLLLFVIFASVFVFIMALLPKYGTNVIMRWIEVLILVLAIKVVAISGLTFFLYIGDVIYSKAAPSEMMDIIVINALKALIVTLIWMFRKTLFRIVTLSGRGAKNVQREFNKNVSPSRQFGYDYRDMKGQYEHFQDGVGAFKNFAGRFRSSEKADYETSEDVPKDNANQSSATYQQWFSSVRDRMQDYKDKKADFKSKDDIAQEFLREQYYHEKEQAEEMARMEFARTGEERTPQYTDFVKQTMFNYEHGKEPFSKSDRMTIIKHMNQMEQAGEDPMKIFDRFKPKDEHSEDHSESRDYDYDHDHDYQYQDEYRQNHQQDDGRESRHESGGEKSYEGGDDYEKEGPSLDEYIIRQEMKQNMDFVQNIDRSSTINQMTRAYLHNQYLHHKLDAHVAARMAAEKTGKAVTPEYNPFVEKVNERIKKNHNPFTKDEIAKAEEYVKDLDRYGFDPSEHIKKMESEDVSKFMDVGSGEKEKVYDARNVKTPKVDFSDLETVLGEMDQRIDEKLKNSSHENKIDYEKIRQILENDIRESKSIEEIRDDVMKLHKDVNQPFDNKKVEQLARRVAENQDFEAITDYVASLEGRDDDEAQEETNLD